MDMDTVRQRTPAPAPIRGRRARMIVRPILAVLGRLWRLRWWQKIALVVVVSMVSTSAWIYYGPASLEGKPPLQNAFLYDRSGHLLAELSPEQNRVVISISKIPKMAQQAFIAAEDSRFYSHPGVDVLAIARAAWADVRGGREGASTITQQYVKNTFVGSSRTIARKLREAILALRIDRRYPKSKILEAYLNTIYLGQGAYGIEAASRLYFGVHAQALSLPQAALLAGITFAPSRYSPRLNPKGARSRRAYVLGRMQALGMISATEAAVANSAPIVLARPDPRPVVSPAFVDWARRELIAQVGEEQLYRGGLRVQTTLDLAAQRAAEKAIADTLGEPGDPEVAVVSIEAATGEVRVMVGGRNRHVGDLNLAVQTRRQPGSSFKPFVLAAALMKGKTLDDTYRGPSTIEVTVDGIGFKTTNYEREGYGTLSVRSATAYSVNTVFAQLIRDIGINPVIAVAHRLGIRSPLRAVPSIAIGAEPVSVLEMASAYTPFSQNGLWVQPTGLHAVTTIDGRVLFDGPRQPEVVLPIEIADGVKDALGAVMRYGTGARVRLDRFPAFGKTGTTDDHADAWFVGFAGGYVTAVWVGYPNRNAPMTNVHGIKVTGNSFPATIWMKTMNALLANVQAPPDESSGVTPGPTGSPGRNGQSSPSPSAAPDPSPSPSRKPFPIPLPSIP